MIDIHKTRMIGLRSGEKKCIAISKAVSIKYQNATDGQIDRQHCYINKCKKKLWFIQELTAHDTSKTAKNRKKVITHQHIA